MTSKSLVENFLSQKNIAVVGVSRNTNEQPRSKLRGILIELKKKCYNVFPINPNAEKIEGDKCYPDLLSLTLKNLCSL